MPTLRKDSLEQYLQSRFGSGVTLLKYEVFGKASSKGAQKQYGYGTSWLMRATTGLSVLTMRAFFEPKNFLRTQETGFMIGENGVRWFAFGYRGKNDG